MKLKLKDNRTPAERLTELKNEILLILTRSRKVNKTEARDALLERGYTLAEILTAVEELKAENRIEEEEEA